MKTVDVVAALIWNHDGQFLICQRPPHKSRGLLWEFVGGKVEAGECADDALIRECYEELGIEICVGNIFTEVVHTYPDISIRLIVYYASIQSGSITKLEHNDIRWIHVFEIPNYTFCHADEVILQLIIAQFG